MSFENSQMRKQGLYIQGMINHERKHERNRIAAKKHRNIQESAVKVEVNQGALAAKQREARMAAKGSSSWGSWVGLGGYSRKQRKQRTKKQRTKKQRKQRKQRK